MHIIPSKDSSVQKYGNNADFLPSSLTDRAPFVENTYDDASQSQSAHIGCLSNNSNRTVSPSVLEKVDRNSILVPAIDLQCTTRKSASCLTPVSANSLPSIAYPLIPITHLKPIDIRPIPKFRTNRKRKIQGAELTSTPIKE